MIRPRKRRVAMLSILFVLCGAMLLSINRADEAKTEWKAPARAAKRKNPIAADDASVAAGKVVYTKECFSCHGAAGKGDGPAAKDLTTKPGDLSNSKVWNETDGELFWKITEGKKPRPTFAKLLSDDQRWNAVNYIRTLAPKPAGGSTSSEGDQK